MPHKPRGGAPRGNQNARKHGFYSTALSPDERALLASSALHNNLLSEIGLVRVKLSRLAEHPDASPDLILKAVRTISRMLDLQFRVIGRRRRAKW